ncbi:MAG: YkvA family protein [Terracoccus sp.]
MKAASRIKIAATVASVLRAATRPGAPAMSERVQAVPRLLRATRDGSYAGTTVRRLALVAGAVAYVASPIDLLPEAFLPVLGAADDAVVISWAVKAFLEETDRFLAWELGQGVRAPRGPRGGAGSSTWGTPATWGTSSSQTAGASSTGRGDEGLGTDGGPGRGSAAGVRDAATDYLMESLRKRLER